MSESSKLGTGDLFPPLNLETVGGGELTLPRDIDTKFGLILFYRGHW